MKNSNLYRLVPSGQLEDEVVQCTSAGSNSAATNRDDGNMQISARSAASGADTLMVDPDTGSIVPIVELEAKEDTPTRSEGPSEESVSELNLSSLFTVFLLFFINLINYIDRYTTAGVLKEIIHYYHIPDSQAGLLQVSMMAWMARILVRPYYAMTRDIHLNDISIVPPVFRRYLSSLTCFSLPFLDIWATVTTAFISSSLESLFGQVNPALLQGIGGRLPFFRMTVFLMML